MRAGQLRLIHIDTLKGQVEWCWTTEGNCRVLLYNKFDNNRKVEIDCEPEPSKVKAYIISTYYPEQTQIEW